MVEGSRAHAITNAGTMPNENCRCFSVRRKNKPPQTVGFSATCWQNSRLSSAGGEIAAIRMEDLPDHVGRILAREEQEGGGDLVRLAGPAKRGVLAEVLQVFRLLPAERVERGPDRP